MAGSFKRIEKRDERLTVPHQRQVGAAGIGARRRNPDPQQEVGAGGDVGSGRRDLRALLDEGSVREPGGQAGAAFDGHRQPRLRQGRHDRGDHGHAPFPW